MDTMLAVGVLSLVLCLCTLILNEGLKEICRILREKLNDRRPY